LAIRETGAQIGKRRGAGDPTQTDRRVRKGIAGGAGRGQAGGTGRPHHRRARDGPLILLGGTTIYRKLKRYDEEVALIRRFARNYDIHFRAFSKRYRSRSGTHEAWAAKFLERFDKAKTAAAARSEDNNN
jgi:hypothetical protein